VRDGLGEIADRLEALAALLDLNEARPYAPRAYRRAAETIRETPAAVPELVRTGRVRDLRGIGPGIESRLRELVETGRLAELDALESLRGAVPAGDARRARLAHSLALGWLAVGDFSRAEPLLIDELDLLGASGRPEDVQAARSALADICDATGRPDEAARWREGLAAPASGEAPR